MRITHVTPYYPPDRLGGVGEVVAHTHELLLDLGHHSTVITSGRSQDKERVVRIANSPMGFALRSVSARNSAIEADVIHVHHGEAIGLVAALLASAPRPTVLLTLHVDNRLVARSSRGFTAAGLRYRAGFGGALQAYAKAPAKAMLDRAVIGMADRVSFVSRAGAIEVLGNGQGGIADVVRNGVHSPTIVTSTGHQIPRTEILYVGSSSLRKRVLLLPEILVRVRQRLPRARMRIIGFEKSSNPRLVDQFQRRGLEDAVDWAGVHRSRDIGRYYRASDLLLLPSAYEGLPMVILEAMSAGLPVVSTDVGGISEVVSDGVNGFLAPTDDIAALSQACLKVLQPADGEPRLADPIVLDDEFSVEAQVAGYLEIYETIHDQK